MSLKTREVQVKAMKKYDELGQWHTMEGDTPEQAVQKLAENGVISPKPTKRRKPRKHPEQHSHPLWKYGQRAQRKTVPPDAL